MSASGNISNSEITESLYKFKRRYYLNLMIKGSIYAFLFLISSFVFVTVLEYYFYFNSTIRAIFLTSFVGISIYTLYNFVVKHFIAYSNPDKYLSDEEAAKLIGQHFPEINDKLLNTIQLNKITSQASSDLVWAGIKQKTYDVIKFPFFKAINLSENKKHLKYVYLPLGIVLLLSFFIPQLFTQGTSRIINFNKKYEKPKPFTFQLENTNLTVFKNENLDLNLTTNGLDLEEVYLIKGGISIKMKKEKNGNHTYSLQNINSDDDFFFSAIGYDSETYSIKVVERPAINNVSISIDYPKYLNKKNETLSNIGNLNVPEGTKINWNINAKADSVYLTFGDKKFKSEEENNGFSFSKTAKQSESYKIDLINEYGVNKEPIINFIEVTPDVFPTIKLEDFFDTITYSTIYFVGSISDDYGFSGMHFNYRVIDERNNNKPFLRKSIAINGNSTEQKFNYSHNFNEIKPGEKIEYFVSVSDNDGVNGAKTTKSGISVLNIPDKKEISAELENKTNSVEKKMEDMLKESKKAKQETKKINDKLKTKNQVNWNENKQVEDLLKKHQQMNEALENLKEDFKNLNKQKNKFDNTSESLKEKHEQLQKLMNEVLDEETKKLMEELEKLLNEKKNDDDLKNKLDELNKKDLNVEKQIERAIELFKQLKLEEKLEKTIDELNKLAEKQENLAEKTAEKAEDKKQTSEEKKENLDKLNKEQDKLNKEFEELKKELDKIEELNKELENKQDLENTEEQEKSIDEDQKDSKEELEKNNKSKASKSQKSASDKMKDMAKKMQKKMDENSAEAVIQNIEDLRNLLENLVKLSYDQEDVMKEFRTVNQADPKFIALSQKQIKVKDDAKIIEDSLYALSKRIVEIESFVTKEVTEMNEHIDKSVDFIKQRRTPQAGSSQQFAMSSMNNLALLLSDVLKQLQSQAESKSSGEGSCKKPGKKKGGKGGKPKPGDIGKMQKDLNDKISQLKQSGKTGKQLSEGLAKMAAEQEMLRNALKELEQMSKEGNKDGKGDGGMGSKLNEIKKQMEETEKELYNKKLTNEMILRQQDILTRLLEAEKAVRERELDTKRESNTGQDVENKFPPKFDEYLKNKQKEIELIKTVSPEYNKYYKSETNKYFEKLSTN